jgi:hypothetical protein
MNSATALLECGRCGLVEILRESDRFWCIDSVLICSRCAERAMEERGVADHIENDALVMPPLPHGLLDEAPGEEVNDTNSNSYAAAVRRATGR